MIALVILTALPVSLIAGRTLAPVITAWSRRRAAERAALDARVDYYVND